MTTPEKSALHKLGYFSKLHGYKGELTAALDTANNREYSHLQHIFVEVKGELVPYFIRLIEYKTNTTNKVKLDGIDTEESAKELVKSSIYIDPKDLSEDDAEKVELRSMLGYNAIDSEKGPIGKITSIQETANNPLVVILFGKIEILIPLNGGFIDEIDKKKKEVRISAPAGLIDFYLGN